MGQVVQLQQVITIAELEAQRDALDAQIHQLRKQALLIELVKARRSHQYTLRLHECSLRFEAAILSSNTHTTSEIMDELEYLLNL